MLTLLLLRHAKAEASSPEGDFGRALAPRGRKQAGEFGRWLAGKSFAPGLVMASPARRARETADAVIAALRAPPVRRDERGLYNAEAGEILAVARSADPGATSLLIAGHNPGIAELAWALMEDGGAASGLIEDKYPTCACAILRFDIDEWQRLSPRKGLLLDFVTPARLSAVLPEGN